MKVLKELGDKLKDNPKAHGATISQISSTDAEYPVYRVVLPPPKGLKPRKRPNRIDRPLAVKIVAGTHGDEPASILAALALLDFYLSHPEQRRDREIVMVIRLDPHGTRDAGKGVNLNRHMLDQGPVPRVVQDLRLALGSGEKTADLFLDLHTSEQQGGFIIPWTTAGSLHQRIVSALRKTAVLDGRPDRPEEIQIAHPNEKHLRYVIRHPGVVVVPGVKGTMMEYGARFSQRSLTLEGPQALPLAQCVRMLVKTARSAIDNAAHHAGPAGCQRPEPSRSKRR